MFLHLWRNASAFDGSRSSARTWLMMLTHHRAVDRVRSEQRRAASALGEKDDHPDDRPGPEVQAITALLGEGAVSALALLTADKREALVLTYWGGYTQREIAVMTSTPLGTVKTRTRKGADSTAPIPRRRLAAKREALSRTRRRSPNSHRW
ncbi:MAG: sigma-70 family RNA polymerase sigma factor [Euzebyaceae bacterium]|nr:sigma-70 family RNA polymerase sigma factor [Euzebyaceae bacterium]